MKSTKKKKAVRIGKLQIKDCMGQLAAIHEVQGVAEFNLDGTLITANQNFLRALGYTLEEVQEKHHSLFLDETCRQGTEEILWDKLRRGEHEAGEYRRIGKDGRAVWLRASYHAIPDLKGKPFKVVQFAIDISGQKAALQFMMDDVMKLSKEVIEGKLANRADASRHQGDYRTVIEGLNRGMDAVLGPLNTAATYIQGIAAEVMEASQILKSMAENDYTRRVSGSCK